MRLQMHTRGFFQQLPFDCEPASGYFLYMISGADRSRIIAIAKKYGVSRVLAFGSSAAGTEGRDIDLAVAGWHLSRFFAFYGELLFSLSKPVDLVDLENPSPFARLVGAEGIPLYG